MFASGDDILKGTDLRTITEGDVRQAEKRLNLRPRKCLEFRQPVVVFQEYLQVHRRVSHFAVEFTWIFYLSSMVRAINFSQINFFLAE